MLLAGILLLGGLLLLAFGGDWTVRGANGLATRTRVQPYIIGATVIAFGTSAPELAVTLTAIFRDAPGLALGNVVGSNIANLGLILGLGAFLRTIALPRQQLWKDLPVVGGVMVLLILFAWNAAVSRWEGITLLLGAVLAIWWTVRTARRGRSPRPADPAGEEAAPPLLRTLFVLLAGLGALYGGGQLLVEGAVRIAEFFGVAQWVIGVIILALGTSMPEVAASVTAAVKGRGDLAIGNVLGSNAFNVLLVLGTAASARPVTVAVDIRPDLLLFGGMTLFVALLLIARQSLGRFSGLLLLAAYVAYIVERIISG